MTVLEYLIDVFDHIELYDIKNERITNKDSLSITRDVHIKTEYTNTGRFYFHTKNKNIDDFFKENLLEFPKIKEYLISLSMIKRNTKIDNFLNNDNT